MDKFDDFLLSEYEHIANAHFETGKQVSTFFNYYLLILAAPVIIVTLTQNKNLQNIVIANNGEDYIIVHWIAAVILMVISVFGFCLMYIPDHVDPPFLFMLTHHSCMLTQGENIFLAEFIPAC